MWLHLQLLPFLGESHSMQRQPHCFCQVIWWFGTIDAASYAGYSWCRCGHLRLYDTSLVIWNRQWVWTGWNVARIGMRLQMGERKTGEAKAHARSHRKEQSNILEAKDESTSKTTKKGCDQTQKGCSSKLLLLENSWIWTLPIPLEREGKPSSY